MSSNENSISINDLGKRYEIYATPRDRLKQFIIPVLQRATGRQPSSYHQDFWALQDISFEIRKGEAFGIVGRNGSGKSTLLQLIAGTLTPTVGSVETHGRITALLELGSGFNLEFTGRENVYLNGMLLGMTHDEVDARFDQIAAFADIGIYLDQPVKTYSSGMYVRLAFAVQACIEPDILIVDEALSVGDEKFQRKCFDYIERLRIDGCSILLVTHSTQIIEKFCQRAALLHQGQLHGLGNAKEIVDQYHALLYSDEKTYLRYLNNQHSVATTKSSENETPASSEKSENHVVPGYEDKTGMRAAITNWTVLDAANEPVETFRTGDIARIRFWVDVIKPIREVQGGILFRTVEGISAFGTSSLYHAKNYLQAEALYRLRFEFDIVLDLCPGSYFVTFSIAETITLNDMDYLDRKTDVIMLKISQPRLLSTGIAALSSNVNIIREK